MPTVECRECGHRFDSEETRVEVYFARTVKVEEACTGWVLVDYEGEPDMDTLDEDRSTEVTDSYRGDVTDIEDIEVACPNCSVSGTWEGMFRQVSEEEAEEASEEWTPEWMADGGIGCRVFRYEELPPQRYLAVGGNIPVSGDKVYLFGASDDAVKLGEWCRPRTWAWFVYDRVGRCWLDHGGIDGNVADQALVLRAWLDEKGYQAEVAGVIDEVKPAYEQTEADEVKALMDGIE